MAQRARRLNVLYVGTLPPYPGGTAILGAQLLAGLAASGHIVRALAPIVEDRVEGDRFAAQHPELSVRRYPVPYFQTQSHVDVSPDYFRLEGEHIEQQLTTMVDETRPDVIVSGRESVSFFVPAVARRYSIPCVALIQGPTIPAITRGEYPAALGQRLVGELRQVDRVVAVAGHLTGPLRALGFTDVKVIQNAVDLKRFSPGPKDSSLLRELAIPPDATVALHASNLIAAKRPLDVIAAGEDVLRTSGDAFFVIVGDGPLRRQMEDRCTRAGIADRVRFTGWVDHDCMPAYLRVADVVLVPSETEALALIYLEAQASGCVVVASDIPAAREVITDGTSGLLFRKEDVADLTAKTRLAFDDPDRRATIRLGARAAAETHGLDRVVAEYAATLGEAVAP